MGYEHLVGDIELKYLVVKLETRIKNSKLLAKNFFESFYILTLTQHLHP